MVAIVGLIAPSVPGTAGQPQEFVVRIENRGTLPLAKSDIRISRRVLQPSNQQEFPKEAGLSGLGSGSVFATEVNDAVSG